MIFTKKISQFFGLLVFGFLLQGCGGLESVMLGSAMGVLGDQGIEYFGSGKIKKILFYDQVDVENVVENSFYTLDYMLEKHQRFSDNSMLFHGRVEEDEIVNLQVKLSTLVEGVTEVKVTAREDLFLPNQGVCLLLMREIVQQVQEGSPIREEYARR